MPVSPSRCGYCTVDTSQAGLSDTAGACRSGHPKAPTTLHRMHLSVCFLAVMRAQQQPLGVPKSRCCHHLTVSEHCTVYDRLCETVHIGLAPHHNSFTAAASSNTGTGDTLTSLRWHQQVTSFLQLQLPMLWSLTMLQPFPVPIAVIIPHNTFKTVCIDDRAHICLVHAVQHYLPYSSGAGSIHRCCKHKQHKNGMKLKCQAIQIPL